jgi:hypothetical protein
MTPERSLTTHPTEPVVAVLVEEDGQEVVRYFPETQADATTSDAARDAAFAALGSSSDLDWETWADELDRLRHDSEPTPPIEI